MCVTTWFRWNVPFSFRVVCWRVSLELNSFLYVTLSLLTSAYCSIHLVTFFFSFSAIIFFPLSVPLNASLCSLSHLFINPPSSLPLHSLFVSPLSLASQSIYYSTKWAYQLSEVLLIDAVTVERIAIPPPPPTGKVIAPKILLFHSNHSEHMPLKVSCITWEVDEQKFVKTKQRLRSMVEEMRIRRYIKFDIYKRQVGVADNAVCCCAPVRRAFTWLITSSANTKTFLWGEW